MRILSDHPVNETDDTDVLVVGAGPAGLTLAADLLRRGLRVRLIDSAERSATTSRATSLTARTLEVLDDLGVADQLVETGIMITRADAFQGAEPTFSLAFPASDLTRFPFLLNNSQRQTEEVLADLVVRSGGQVERGRTLAGFRQDRQGVVAFVDAPSGSEMIRARWLVGADGSRSTVRRTLAIPFRGTAENLEETIVLADVLVDWELTPDRLYTWFNEDGALLAFPFREPGRWRLTAALSPAEEADGGFTEESLDRFSRLYRRRTGDHTTVLSDLTGFSVYRVNQRVVDHYRRGRVLLAGDAAHIHTPAGGLGMNTGIQDAYNLGWRLALAVRTADDTVVDGYEAERRPVAESLLTSTGGLQRLYSVRDPRLQRARDVALRLVLNAGPTRRAFFAGASQLTISYRRGSLPLRTGLRVGDRSPDGRVTRWPSGQPGWLHEHLRGPAPVLVLFPGSGPAGEDLGFERLVAAAAGRARVVHVLAAEPVVPGQVAGSSESITLLDVDGVLHRRYGARRPTAAIIRPDGHLAALGQQRDVPLLTSCLDALSPSAAVSGSARTPAR